MTNNPKTIILLIALGIIIFLIIIATKSSKKFHKLHEKIKTNDKKLLDFHPYGRFYKIFRYSFQGLLLVWWINVFLGQNSTIGLYIHFGGLGFFILLSIILFFFFCPRCKKSIFLQDVNSWNYMRPPTVCLTCGFPNDEILQHGKNGYKYQPIRPFYKWLAIICIGLPLVAAILGLIYLGIKEQFP